MAVPDHLYPGTIDRSTSQYWDDWSDVFIEVTQPKGRLVLLDRIKVGAPVRNQKAYYNEDKQASFYVQLNGAITTETTWTLETGDDLLVQNGDVLVPYNASDKDETVQINATPNTTAHTISVTRQHNGVAQDTFDDNTKFRVIRSVPEGTEADGVEFVGTTEHYFYTGITAHTIKLTDSAMQGKPHGYVMAELDRQEAKVLLKIKGEQEDLAYFGAGVARASGVHGESSGIRKTIIGHAGDNYSTTAEVWGYKNFNSHVNWIANNSPLDAEPDLVCFCTADMYSAAGFWGAGACTRVASERTFGFETNTIHTTMGLDVPLVWSQFCIPDEYAILDMNYISRHPLGNRALKRFVTPVGLIGNDYEQRRLVSEWGTKTQYAEYAHFLKRGVSVR